MNQPPNSDSLHRKDINNDEAGASNGSGGVTRESRHVGSAMETATKRSGPESPSNPLGLSSSSALYRHNDTLSPKEGQRSLGVPQGSRASTGATAPGFPPDLLGALAMLQQASSAPPQAPAVGFLSDISDNSTQQQDQNSVVASLLSRLLTPSGGGQQQAGPMDTSELLLRGLTSFVNAAPSGPASYGSGSNPLFLLEGLQEQLLQQQNLPRKQAEGFSAVGGLGATVSLASAGLVHQADERSSPNNQDQSYSNKNVPLTSTTGGGKNPRSGDRKQKSKRKRKENSSTTKERIPKKDAKIGSTVVPTTIPAPVMAPASSSVDASTGNAPAGRPFLLPCRARGMPPDHNFRHAHFVIPSTVQHGEELICSYEACRNAGIKFRYCASCRIPVAKRNFNQRHSHGLSHVSTIHATWSNVVDAPVAAAAVAATFGDELSNAPPAASSNDNVAAARAPAGAKARNAGERADTITHPRRREHQAEQDKSSPSSVPPPVVDKESPGSDESSSAKMRKRTRISVFSGDIGTAEKAEKRSSSNNKRKKSKSDPPIPLLLEPNPDMPLDRQWRWSSLLASRPDMADSDRMSAWLLEVMAVSDVKCPLRDPITSNLSHSSGDFSSSAGSNHRLQARLSSTRSRDDDESTSSLTSSPLAGVEDSADTENDEESPNKKKDKKKDKKKKKKRKKSHSKKSKRSEEDKQELSATFAEWKERKRRKSEDAARQQHDSSSS